MSKPFQTDATIAREQHDHLFEDLLDRCTEEPTPALAGELLNSIDPQQTCNGKRLDSMLQDIKVARENSDKCLDRFDAAVKKTAPKKSSGWLNADVEWRYTNGAYYHDAYKTLALIGRGSFMKWARTSSDGKPTFKTLSPFCFYPALIAESMRMTFVRTSKSQITYMRNGFEWRSPKLIGKTLFMVNVQLPREDTQRRNIIITLERVPGGETCSLEFLFDGEQFHLVNILSLGTFYDKGFDALVKAELINRPEVLDDFLRHCFNPFRCGRLGIYYKNLEDYLGGHTYKVGLAEAVGTPFFIIQKDNRVL